MSTLDRLATALQSVVDDKQLLTDAAAAPYAVDDVPPGVVALPDDETQLSDVLRLAGEYDASVFPRGGGSHLRLGATPERVDLVVGIERMRRQLAYEPGDMTTTVQAGMPLGDLQDALKAEGQFVALDPPATAATTIGGVIATNASGPRRLLYGTARDLVLGLGVVGADGTRSKAGGRVVKNVTGYDLTKLYIGSLGTLAVVHELTFKVHPLPAGEVTIGIACAGHDDVAPVQDALLRLPLRLNSLELLNAVALAALRVDTDVELPDAPYLFLARLEGRRGGDRQPDAAPPQGRAGPGLRRRGRPARVPGRGPAKAVDGAVGAGPQARVRHRQGRPAHDRPGAALRRGRIPCRGVGLAAARPCRQRRRVGAYPGRRRRGRAGGTNTGAGRRRRAAERPPGNRARAGRREAALRGVGAGGRRLCGDAGAQGDV